MSYLCTAKTCAIAGLFFPLFLYVYLSLSPPLSLCSPLSLPNSGEKLAKNWLQLIFQISIHRNLRRSFPCFFLLRIPVIKYNSMHLTNALGNKINHNNDRANFLSHVHMQPNEFSYNIQSLPHSQLAIVVFICDFEAAFPSLTLLFFLLRARSLSLSLCSHAFLFDTNG